MTFRSYLEKCTRDKSLTQIQKPVSKHLVAAGILKVLEPQPVLFSQVSDSDFAVAGNLFCTKQSFADYLNISVQEIIPTLTHAIDHPQRPAVVEQAACQEVILDQPDLDALPILFHCEGDGGNYISSGVMIAGHPQIWSKYGFSPLHAVLQDRDGCAGGENPPF